MTLRVAPLPAGAATHDYGRLLYGALDRHGVEVVAGVPWSVRALLARRREIDVVHFHWDELFAEAKPGPRRTLRSWARLAAFGARLAAVRAAGLRLVWTIHEVWPHETLSRRRDLIAGRLLARAAHALIALDEPTAARAREHLGARDVAVIGMGSYASLYPPAPSRQEARRRLGLADDALVLLSFGTIRAYKRLEPLARAFARVEDPRLALLIEGAIAWRSRRDGDDWHERLVERLGDLAAADGRIRVTVGHASPQRVAELHAAADVAVFARTDGWTSAAIPLAMSLGVPVLVADRPAYVTLLGGDDPAGWTFDADDPAALEDAIARLDGDRSDIAARTEAAKRRAAEWDWTEVADRTAAVLRGGRG